MDDSDIIIDFPEDPNYDDVLVTSFQAVGKYRYLLICTKCRKPNSVTNITDIKFLQCHNCKFTRSVDKFNKSVMIEVEAKELSKGNNIYCLPYEDIQMKFPSLAHTDCFIIDENEVTQVILSLKEVEVHVDHIKRVISFLD